MSLLKYTVRRLLALVPILLGVLFLSFVLSRAMPGNPYLIQFGEAGFKSDAQKAIYEAEVARLGLDEPVVMQFLIYLGNVFSGDWGTSINVSPGSPVWVLIGERFPRTLEITIYSLLFAATLGISAGITSAVNRNNRKDTIIRLIALIGVAIPVFWLGLMLQYSISYKLQLLPATMFNTPYMELGKQITSLRVVDALLQGEWAIAWDTIQHLILPCFCLGYISLAGVTRFTRSSMLEVLELDYIRTARAKGCTEHTVIHKHAWRNAMIPTITVIGLNFAGLLGGAVLTETTFNLPGMGTLTISAIRSYDYALINAGVFLMTIIFVIMNLITDIVYGLVDPRIRF